MMQILICDDDAAFAARLTGELGALMSEKKIPVRFHCFSAASAIGDGTLEACDLAFLDIDLAGEEENGLFLARRLRAQNADAVIVFVTNYVEYAPAGYEVRAFRYLLKEEIAEKLPDCVDASLTLMRAEKSDLRIQVEGEQIALPVRDIVYVESMGHTLCFHTAPRGSAPARSYSCYGTLSKAEEQLSGRGFLRTQKSYLVNMAHIRRLSSAELLLTGGVSLPVSAKNYAACKRQYLLWRGQNGWTL